MVRCSPGRGAQCTTARDSAEPVRGPGTGPVGVPGRLWRAARGALSERWPSWQGSAEGHNRWIPGCARRGEGRAASDRGAGGMESVVELVGQRGKRTTGEFPVVRVADLSARVWGAAVPGRGRAGDCTGTAKAVVVARTGSAHSPRRRATGVQSTPATAPGTSSVSARRICWCSTASCFLGSRPSSSRRMPATVRYAWTASARLPL